MPPKTAGNFFITYGGFFQVLLQLICGLSWGFFKYWLN